MNGATRQVQGQAADGHSWASAASSYAVLTVLNC